jgi:hypothetical protein
MTWHYQLGEHSGQASCEGWLELNNCIDETSAHRRFDRGEPARRWLREWSEWHFRRLTWAWLGSTNCPSKAVGVRAGGY